MAEFLIGNIKGKDATITQVSATVDNSSGTPKVEVSMGGTESERSFHFAFSGLKGEKGDGIDPTALAEFVEEQNDTRTHYAEEILVCDFTFTDSYEDDALKVYLSNTIDMSILRAYLNGKSVEVKYEENSEGAFDVQLFDTETGDEVAWFNYSPTTWTGRPEPSIYFQPYNDPGENIKLYEEHVYTLDEKYLPDSVPKMINYDGVLLCEYTYNADDFVDYACPSVALRRVPNRDRIKLYINEEEIPVRVESIGSGNFVGRHYLGETVPTYFTYWADDNKINFYCEDAGHILLKEGDVARIVEDGVSMLKDADIPDFIARTDEIKAYIDEAIKKALNSNS